MCLFTVSLAKFLSVSVQLVYFLNNPFISFLSEPNHPKSYEVNFFAENLLLLDFFLSIMQGADLYV